MEPLGDLNVSLLSVKVGTFRFYKVSNQYVKLFRLSLILSDERKHLNRVNGVKINYSHENHVKYVQENLKFYKGTEKKISVEL